MPHPGLKIFRIIILTLATALGCGSFAAGAEPFVWNCSEQGNEFAVSCEVAPGNYLYYDDSFELDVRDGQGREIQPVSAPEAVMVDDLFSGLTATLPPGRHIWKFTGEPPFTAVISFHGCAFSVGDQPALCYLPATVELTTREPLLNQAAEAFDADIQSGLLDEFTTVRKLTGMVDEKTFAEFLSGTGSADAAAAEAPRGVIYMLLVALLGGLALNLTPCVLPMIPINLAIIGAGSASGGRASGFKLGLAYGAGMTAAYGALGAAVILFGARFGQLNSSYWFNFAVAALFAVLSLATFGVFNLDLSGKARFDFKKLPGGAAVTAVCMGAAAALLAGACVAPVVISVLLFAAELYNRSAWALLLPLALGAGMALPWPLAGAGLAVLPKPGRFMVAVKYIFGTLIMLAALWYCWLGITLLPGRFSTRDEFVKLDTALEKSIRTGTPVLIDFWASWCKNCHAMEHGVLSKPEVQSMLEKFVFVKFQAENLSDREISALLKRWNLPGLPSYVILAPPPGE